jgi:hypothetical protein
MKKEIKRNPKGITKQYLLKYALRFEWLNEYEIREHLIKKFPAIFSHKTKLATIRHYHLIPLENERKIQKQTSRYGEIQYRKTPVGIEEFETNEDTDVIFKSVGIGQFETDEETDTIIFNKVGVEKFEVEEDTDTIIFSDPEA